MKKIVLQGIAYDAKSSFMTGPAEAPDKIRSMYRSDSANYYSESGLEIQPWLIEDQGNLNPVQYFDIEVFTTSNLNNNLPLITLGGDHSITYPLLRAFHKKYGKFNVLHIDAHADLYDEFEGDKYSHACPFARIMEEGMALRLVQLGIRTMTQHQREQAERFGVETYSVSESVPRLVSELDGPLYLSLDMDALDPAFAPGVSHHEPGGFSSREVINLIKSIKAPLIGADIVEYNPRRDINDCTAMLCAKLFKEIAAVMILNQPNRTNPQDA